MKKIGLLIGLFTLSMNYAQIKFEKGYIINNSGERTEVLIKDVDWKNNPTDFEYKLNDSSAPIKESVKNIAEFAIDNSEKYVRKTVMIDHSSDIIAYISKNKTPDFKEETLFLKYVVEGKANLYYYQNNDTKRFFYNIDQSDIKQLIYKPYYVNESLIRYNNEYKKQIAENLTCGIENKEIERADYKTNALTRIFVKYNNCSNGGSVNYTQNKEKRDFINLNIRPGISSSKLQTTFNSYDPAGKTDFDRKFSFRIGAELEFILPYNKNKWSVFIEPTYQYYKTDSETVVNVGTYFERKITQNIDYKALDVPIGARHYMFLNDKSKIFINAAFIIGIGLNSSFKEGNTEMKIKSANNIAFGAGYKYNDKFSVELRVHTTRNLLRNYVMWDSNYNNMSLIFGYTLF
ncbi:PorT family protein [Chryseobacterium paludis]|uniref:PorT family protein n=1 Tax=Chryseobacterium paludis TaxID=2956784 RepID=UPI0021C18646|nr:PorT family protein [Chryseobacterium paludis]